MKNAYKDKKPLPLFHKNQTSTGLLVSYLLMALGVAGVLFFGYKMITIGKSSTDYRTICIEGHEYYTVNLLAKTSLAISLDDVGRPVWCDEDE